MKHSLLAILISLTTALCSAQTAESTDSLKRLAAETDNDSLKTSIYVQIATMDDNADTIAKYANMAIEIASRRNDLQSQMYSYDNLGYAQYYKMEFHEAIKSYDTAIQIAKQLDDSLYMASLYRSIGNAYNEVADNRAMWEAYYQSLNIYTAKNAQDRLRITYRTFAEAFSSVKLYESASENIYKSMYISEQLGEMDELAYDYLVIGNIMMKQYAEDTTAEATEKILAAKNFLKKAEAMMPDMDNDYNNNERANNLVALADCYDQLAQRLHDKKYIDSCRYYINAGKATGSSELEIEMLIPQYEADLLMMENKHAKALPILHNILEFATAQKNLHNEMTIQLRLYKCYNKLGDKTNALNAAVEYYKLQQKFASEAEMKRSAELQVLDQREKEKRELEQEKQRQQILDDAERHKQKIINTSMLIGIILLAIIAILLYNAFSKKKRFSELMMSKNIILEQQKEEIETQNDALREKSEEISRQRDLLAEQKENLSRTNSQMRDSITYAQRIQRTVISSQEEIDQIFPENFVLYKAKDIVSGDFYRTEIIRGHKIAVVSDCTGHGVPGALLSMMGISALKDILAQYEIDGGDIDPAKILDQMRESVKNSFNRNTTTDPRFATGDGMDMAICIIRPDGLTMDFAGANQSAIIVHDHKARRLKGDFMPIGNYIRENKFTRQTIKISHGDMLYLYTDGIQDQLRGTDDSKFSLKRLIEHLENMSGMSLSKQMFEMEKDIELWMGQKIQLDDMTLLGVRL